MIEIIGDNEIKGKVYISGSKNVALPVIASAILTKKVVVLKNVPRIDDVEVLLSILNDLSVKTIFIKNKLIIDSRNIKYKNLVNQNVEKIRASSYLLSTMLYIFKRVELSYPGGCSLGNRKLDFHFDAFERLGVNISSNEKYIDAYIEKFLPNDIIFSKKSVGATINTIILAGFTKQAIKIYNYAKEPEVMHTIEFLRKIGYRIYEFRDYLLVAGKSKNKNIVRYKIPPDRIETISYMMLGLKAKKLKVKRIIPSELTQVFSKIDLMGGNYKLKKNEVIIKKGRLRGTNIVASSYPSFPTDAQPLIASVLLDAITPSTIVDTIYPERFNYVESLNAMNCNTSINKNVLKISKSSLCGNVIKGYDLRGVFSLIIAASTAKGKTTILDGDIALRGYEKLSSKLNNIGIKNKII